MPMILFNFALATFGGCNKSAQDTDDNNAAAVNKQAENDMNAMHLDQHILGEDVRLDEAMKNGLTIYAFAKATNDTWDAYWKAKEGHTNKPPQKDGNPLSALDVYGILDRVSGKSHFGTFGEYEFKAEKATDVLTFSLNSANLTSYDAPTDPKKEVKVTKVESTEPISELSKCREFCNKELEKMQGAGSGYVKGFDFGQNSNFRHSVCELPSAFVKAAVCGYNPNQKKCTHIHYEQPHVEDDKWTPTDENFYCPVGRIDEPVGKFALFPYLNDKRNKMRGKCPYQYWNGYYQAGSGCREVARALNNAIIGKPLPKSGKITDAEKTQKKVNKVVLPGHVETPKTENPAKDPKDPKATGK